MENEKCKCGHELKNHSTGRKHVCLEKAKGEFCDCSGFERADNGETDE